MGDKLFYSTDKGEATGWRLTWLDKKSVWFNHCLAKNLVVEIVAAAEEVGGQPLDFFPFNLKQTEEENRVASSRAITNNDQCAQNSSWSISRRLFLPDALPSTLCINYLP